MERLRGEGQSLSPFFIMRTKEAIEQLERWVDGKYTKQEIDDLDKSYNDFFPTEESCLTAIEHIKFFSLLGFDFRWWHHNGGGEIFIDYLIDDKRVSVNVEGPDALICFEKENEKRVMIETTIKPIN